MSERYPQKKVLLDVEAKGFSSLPVKIQNCHVRRGLQGIRCLGGRPAMIVMQYETGDVIWQYLGKGAKWVIVGGAKSSLKGGKS